MGCKRKRRLQSVKRKKARNVRGKTDKGGRRSCYRYGLMLFAAVRFCMARALCCAALVFYCCGIEKCAAQNPLQNSFSFELGLMRGIGDMPFFSSLFSYMAKPGSFRFLKRKFINSGALRPKIPPSEQQKPEFPVFSAAVFIPKFFDIHERLEQGNLSRRAHMRFAAMTDFFPFEYLDKYGNLTGYNIDLARALCLELAIENICSIEAAPWEELEERLKSGKVDALIAGLAPSNANRAYFRFSRAYMRFPARFMVRSSSGAQQDSLKFMRLGYDFSEFLQMRGGGFRVGAIAGTAHEEMLKSYFSAQPAEENLKKNNSGNRLILVHFPAGQDMLAALSAGEIDFAFGDGLQFSLWLRQCGNSGAGAVSRASVYGECLRQGQDSRRSPSSSGVERAVIAQAALTAPFAASSVFAAAAGAASGGETANKDKDAAVEDKQPCCAFIGGPYLSSVFLGQGLRIAVAGRDPALEQALNYALRQLEIKGKTAELYLRYFSDGFY